MRCFGAALMTYLHFYFFEIMLSDFLLYDNSTISTFDEKNWERSSDNYVDCCNRLIGCNSTMVNILIVLNSQLQHTPQHTTHSTQIQWRYRHHRCYPHQDGWWHEGWICPQCKSSQWEANQIYGRGRGYVHRIYFVLSLWLFVLYEFNLMFMIVVQDVSLLHHCFWVDC